MIKGKPTKNQQGTVVYIELKNGSTIDIQSYDQDSDKFESNDYDWTHFDEPPPRAIWVAVRRGHTDRLGRCWLAMTPLKEAWIYDEIISRKDVGKYNFDIEDNLGFGLTRAGIDEFEKTLTDDEKEARLRGRFFHLTGLVYKSYGDIHQIKRMKMKADWNMYLHIDTHPRTPHHAVWVAVLPDNKKYIVGELVNSDPLNSVGPYCKAISVYEKNILNCDSENVIRLIEPGSSTPNPVKDGLSIKDDFIKNGIYTEPGSKNRDAGILLFQNELKYDIDKKLYPNIFIFDDLEKTDKELRHYVWDDHAKKAAEKRTEKQAPKDKNDHLIEGIHRILLKNPIYFDPEQGSAEITEYVDEGAFLV